MRLPHMLNSKTPYYVHPRSASFAFCFVFKATFCGIFRALWLRFTRKAIRSATTRWQHPPSRWSVSRWGQPRWHCNLCSLKRMGLGQGEVHTIPGHPGEKHPQRTATKQMPLTHFRSGQHDGSGDLHLAKRREG